MALKITDDCVNCGACAAICPVGAISQEEESHSINPDQCIECNGHYEVSQCADVCPTDACVRA